jgi:hypothetical protein
MARDYVRLYRGLLQNINGDMVEAAVAEGPVPNIIEVETLN